MPAPRRQRAVELAAGRPLVSADLATVTWLTGIVTDVETGPSPFSAPPIVVVDPDGSVVAVVSEDEAPSAARDVEVRGFPGFAVEDVDRAAAATELALDALLTAHAVAVDLASLPGTLVWALARRGVDIVDVGTELRRARAVKDPDELDAIRASTAVADAGQAAARAALRDGSSELDLWAATRAAMERAAGGRVPLVADLVTGERTAEVGGLPGDRRVREGELLLVDLVPRVGAYWADSCALVVLGEPPADARRLHAAALEALDAALGLLRPGVRAAEIDAVARGTVERAGGAYPHHTGHGVGTSWHEEPRVVPASEHVLEEGMVVALEPGAYGEGWGVRVERVAVVVADGPEVLSGHDVSL